MFDKYIIFPFLSETKTTAGGDGIRMIGGMAEIMIAEQAEIENNQTENMTVLGIKNFSVL